MMTNNSNDLFVQNFDLLLGDEIVGHLKLIFSKASCQYVVLDVDGVDLNWFDDKKDAIIWSQDYAENYFIDLCVI